MGIFDIPVVKRSPHGILALVLGIVLGGLGILITGAVAKHKNTIIVGGIMMAGSILLTILGFVVMPLFSMLAWLFYVWALVWGIMIFVKSTSV
jgi:hypothetical protein